MRRAYRVRILDDLSNDKQENIASIPSKDVEVLVGDIANLSTVEATIQEYKYVFHEAAIASVSKPVNDPIGTGKVNYRGTLNVLEAAHKHGFAGLCLLVVLLFTWLPTISMQDGLAELLQATHLLVEVNQ